MADYEIAEATILSKGDIQQIHYEDKNTGQPKVFTKFAFESLVGDESVTFEGSGTDHAKLNVGSRYAFTMQDKGQYNDVVRKITLLEEGEAPVATPTPSTDATPKPKQAVTPSPKAPTPGKTDLPSRWREYNSNARTAQMQSTDRVGKYIDLLIAGKLCDDEGNVVDKVRKSTIENWYAEEIDRYWKEHDVRIPQDTWGNLDGSIS